MTNSVGQIFDAAVEMDQSVVNLDQLVFNVLLVGIEIQRFGLKIVVALL